MQTRPDGTNPATKSAPPFMNAIHDALKIAVACEDALSGIRATGLLDKLSARVDAVQLSAAFGGGWKEGNAIS